MNTTASTPAYHQIVAGLRQGILEGTYQPGTRVPSDAELTRQYAVCRATVTRAVGELVREGLLYRVQGKGTFVASKERPARTGNVGVLVGDVHSKFYSKVVRLLGDACSEVGYHTIVASTLASLDREKRLINELLFAKKVDGFIVCSVNLSRKEEQDFYRSLRRRGIPLVVLFPQEQINDLFTLTTDHEGMGEQAVKHLAAVGCRRIGHVATCNRHYVDIRERLAGYRKAMDALGLPVDEELIFEVPDATEMHGYELGLKLARMPNRPEGLCTLTDEIAFGVMAGLRSCGLDVPRDIRLVGSDNVDMGGDEGVQLTTMDPPYQEICNAAIQGVLSLRDNPSRQLEPRVFPARLVVRGSCGARLSPDAA